MRWFLNCRFNIKPSDLPDFAPPCMSIYRLIMYVLITFFYTFDIKTMSTILRCCLKQRLFCIRRPKEKTTVMHGISKQKVHFHVHRSNAGGAPFPATRWTRPKRWRVGDRETGYSLRGLTYTAVCRRSVAHNKRRMRWRKSETKKNNNENPQLLWHKATPPLIKRYTFFHDTASLCNCEYRLSRSVDNIRNVSIYIYSGPGSPSS